MKRLLVTFFVLLLFGACQSGGESGVPDSGDVNPCLSQKGCVVIEPGTGIPGTLKVVCGWDRATNVCYSTMWCAPSVVSKNPCPFAPAQSSPNLRPESAVCSGAMLSYTYEANTLPVWGANLPGSAYGATVKRVVTDLDGSVVQPLSYYDVSVEAYVCVSYGESIAVCC